MKTDRLRRLLATLALLLALPAAHAVDERDLLPVDQAFVLKASAPTRERIEVSWTIAPGYYLYRHRMGAEATAGFSGGALALPAGKRKTDEFFGDVETYRGNVIGVLAGTAGGDTATLKVKYQGCADLGICYPPQTRTLTVALPPAAGADPAGGLGGLARSLGGAATGSLFGDAGQALPPPLPAEQAFRVEAIAGDGNTLLLRFTPAKGYYLYRDRTSLALDAGPGLAATLPPPARWPRGTPYRDEHFGDVTVYFDQVELQVPVTREHARAADGVLTVGLQGCQTGGICYPPMTRRLQVALPTGRITPKAETAPVAPVAAATPGSSAAGGAPAAVATDATPALPDGAVPGVAAATPATGADAANPATSGRATPFSAAPRGANLGLLAALLFAVLGGLVLNLMPCVLPVLSLKALSLAGSGADPRAARAHALWYTAGVLASFVALGALALGLRSAGLALGWGFQLQQPLVVAVLGLLLFALGLSLSGVWLAGGRWVGAGQGLAARKGPAGDFFTGVLAVVVATPCTAPFMGAALAWAFTAPAGVALLVFAALGLGLALPFLLIGFVPALARRLPRPGPWMETFKQVLAFPMYLTAAWLAWVLGRQRGADALGWWLLAAIVLAFALWAWTRGRMLGRRWALVAAVLAFAALAWPLLAIHRMPRPQAAVPAAAAADALPVVPYSAQRLADLRRANRVVFVNMTADWCVTCKANEKAVFRGGRFARALEAADAVYMVGDWTDVDPQITAFLQEHRAVGVPLYVVYPRGGRAGVVLPTVLSAGVVEQALAAAGTPAP